MASASPPTAAQTAAHIAGQTVRADAPPRAGLALRRRDVRAILAERPDIGWFELDAAALLAAGEADHHALGAVRLLYPATLRVAPPEAAQPERWLGDRLDRIAAICRFYRPLRVSVDLSLAPGGAGPEAPSRALAQAVAVAASLRAALDRPVVLSGPVEAMRAIAEAARRTGCGVALDLGALLAATLDAGRDAGGMLGGLSAGRVAEFRLSGFERIAGPDGPAARRPSPANRIGRAAWATLASVVARFGPAPTLVDWDSPEADWPRRCAEVQSADHILLTGGALRSACAL